MPYTNAEWLPTYDELTVDEIKLTSAPLRAAAHHFGRFCDFQSKEFMLCKAEEKDPRKCINEGKEVTKCGMQFFRKIKANCADSFTAYWKCIDNSSWDMNYNNCRATQEGFDKCVLEHLNQERPQSGYFAKIRLHETKRAKPVPIDDDTLFPARIEDPADPYSENAPPPITREFGSRSTSHI